MSREMKDSGIEWIGKVPDSWSVRRIKDFYTIKSGSGISKDEYVDDGIYPIIGSNGIIGYSNKSNNSHEVITTGRVGTIGSSRLVNKCWITDNTLILDKHTDINNNFTNLILPLLDYDFISTGTAQPLITATKLKNQYIPIPDIEEQNTISAYLKNIVTVLESIIQKTKSTIEDYKLLKQSIITEAVTKGLDKNVEMKDSGIEWIGEIPNHWRTTKVKFIADVVGRIGFRGYTQDDLVCEGEGAITISPSNIKNSKMDYSKCSYLSWDKYKESPEIQLKDGDVLLVKTGSTFGKVSFVEKLPMEATINPQLGVLKNIRVVNKYLYYALMADYSRNQINTFVVGGTIPTVSQEKVNNIKIAVPDEVLQMDIVRYLDSRCYEIDALIIKKESLIEEFEAYKKSLIYEYVTGKKEVE